MFKEFMTNVISTDSFKKVLSEEAMYDFAKASEVYLVHSPVLYRLYALYTAAKPPIEERPVFYRKVGMYLYYERFTCNHGEEFYYYIRFNQHSEFYQEHKALINSLILASDPSTLTDYIGTRDLNNYNQFLKEK
jgi:hypothetical protein